MRLAESLACIGLAAGAAAQLSPLPPAVCGGKGYTGSTRCREGEKCVYYNDYYSQCEPVKDGNVAARQSQGGAWEQCGGNGWSGPTTCISGYS